jgi:zinc protease
MKSAYHSLIVQAWLILFLLVPVASSFAENATDYAPPDVTRVTLENGLELVIIPDHRAPVVTHMVWYKAGSADEPRGKSGIAHFLEHLMFKGTSTTPAGEFSAKVAEIGGQENAFTTADYTVYYQKVSPEALAMVMHYEADRMENLVLSDAVIEPEKKVILEERRSRVDANPSAIIGESVDATLFMNHPYGTPVIGWPSEMLQLTRQDALAFYNKFYSPNNVVLVVAGDVDPAATIDMAGRTYGKVARRVEKIERDRPVEPEPTSARTVEYSDPRVAVDGWQRVYLVPSYTKAEPGEAEALDLLAEILGGSSTSRIYRKLVIETELATSASAWYGSSGLDYTRFGFGGMPRDSHTAEEIEQAIDTIIDELVRDGITEDELSRAKNSLVKTVIFERDSQTAMARLYGTVLSLGGTLDDINNWPGKIGKVTVGDVKKVAEKYLRKSRSVTSFLRTSS